MYRLLTERTNLNQNLEHAQQRTTNTLRLRLVYYSNSTARERHNSVLREPVKITNCDTHTLILMMIVFFFRLIKQTQRLISRSKCTGSMFLYSVGWVRATLRSFLVDLFVPKIKLREHERERVYQYIFIFR